jgi:hypothetical protein
VLPDFISVKQFIQNQIQTVVRAYVARDALLSQFKKEVHFEGDGTSHGDSTETRSYKEFSVPIEIKKDELLARGPAAFAARIPEIAEAMISQQTGTLLGSVREAAESVGNVVDGGGQPLTVELLIESLEKMVIEFGDDGKPKNLIFVAHPDAAKRLGEPTPEQKVRLDELLDRKRREWRDRESNRKLVD